MISEPEVLVAPAVEPVSLTELKAHVRESSSDEDQLLERLIQVARERVEDFTRLALIERTVRFTYPGFGRGLPVPAWPVQSVSAVRYTATDGTDTLLDAARYTVVSARPRVIVPAYGDAWPAALPHWNAVRVEVVTGFGGAPADVPAELRQAILMIAGTLFQHRETAIVGSTVAELKGVEAAEAMMMPFVFWSVSQ